MRLTRRRFITTQSILAALAASGSNWAQAIVGKSPPILCTEPEIAHSPDSSLISDEGKPAGTVIITRHHCSGYQALIVNGGDDELTVRELAPALIRIHDRIHDLNAELREKPLVVPARSVRSTRLQQLTDWQVQEADKLSVFSINTAGQQISASIARNGAVGIAEHSPMNIIT